MAAPTRVASPTLPPGRPLLPTPKAPPTSSTKSRIIILMVWDGLRPDSVNGRDTPHLDAMLAHGVRFARHHSVYPTITMVNAAALATGTGPANNGIFGDAMDLIPALDPGGALADPALKSLIAHPFSLEDSHKLALLNGPSGFRGSLNSAPSLAHEVIADGGYVALIGKQGPTYLFDTTDLAAAPPPPNLLLVADDMAIPASFTASLAAAPKFSHDDAASIVARDAWFTRLAIDQALPDAATTSAAGHPSLIVLWQHNPDMTQHRFGLGTQPALDALTACDRNLAAIRLAIAKQHLDDRTDLVVVSDHGFASIKMTVPLGDLLVAAHLKQSATSNDIVVAHDGGSDLVYLSRAAFPSPASFRSILTRIVAFAASHEWCGPIFARDPDPSGHHDNYKGAIPGTFSQSYFSLNHSDRTPDLIISFRELPNVSNFSVTGPMNPGLTATLTQPTKGPNRSVELVRPTDGLVYSDAGTFFTTGMGMHGSAGERELHNFGGASGLDFKQDFVDTLPTANSDIAPTIGALLGLRQPAAATGRFLREALSAAGDPEANYLHRLLRAIFLRLQDTYPATFATYPHHYALDLQRDRRHFPPRHPLPPADLSRLLRHHPYNPLMRG